MALVKFSGVTPGFNQKQVSVEVDMDKADYTLVHRSFGSITTLFVNGEEKMEVTSDSLLITSK